MGLAKALIMLVRVLGLFAIVLGVMVWGGSPRYLGPHIACGFLVATVIFVLALLGFVKRIVIPAILAIVLAVLLPVFGLKQLPLTFHTVSTIQVIHVVAGLLALGIAEGLHAAMRRAG